MLRKFYQLINFMTYSEDMGCSAVTKQYTAAESFSSKYCHFFLSKSVYIHMCIHVCVCLQFTSVANTSLTGLSLIGRRCRCVPR